MAAPEKRRRDVLAVLRLYPRIFHACHAGHAGTHGGSGLSERDIAMLAHLDVDDPVSLTALARHLGVRVSSLSEAMTRLAVAGYVEKRRLQAVRQLELRLTDAGLAAIERDSVLDADRVAALLGCLSPRQRTQAIEGLKVLACAAGALPGVVPARATKPR